MSTPVTVNVFTTQDLTNTGALSIQDISDFMPGVDIGDGATTQTGITIRGVSSPNISSGGDPSAATFYDGSYVPRAATTIPFADLERTEVLMGPQGTLFGRNATAGVVNIVPNAPKQEFEAFLKVRLGNYDLQRYEGMINLPLGDQFALRANLLAPSHDGVVNQKGIGPEPHDEDVKAGRVSLLWTSSDTTSLQLSADMEDRDEAPRDAIGVGIYAYGNTAQERLNPFSGDTAHDVIGAEETREMQGYSLKLNQDISDNWSLYAVTSYRDWETTNLEEEDGTADARRYFDTNNIEDSDIWYNEVRFNFVNDKFDLMLGANYSEEDMSQTTDIHITTDAYMQFVTVQAGFGGQDDHAWEVLGDNPAVYLGYSEAFGIGLVPPSYAGTLFTEDMINTGEFTNWGVFADVPYNITDDLRIAAGMRYSEDDKTYTWQTNPSDLDWPVPPQRLDYDPSVIDGDPKNNFAQYKRKDSWNDVTGRLVLDWQFADNAMVFGSVATGYRSGGFDGQTFEAVITDPFDPEEVTSYELGLKGDFFNDKLRIESALFYMEIDNKQDTKSTKDSLDDPTASPKVVSGEEEIQGIELIATWSVTDVFRLEASSTYRDVESVFSEYYKEKGELAGGEKESGSTDMEYTIRMDWTPEIPVGYLLVHVDYVFEEDGGSNENTAIFHTGPWYFQDKKQLSVRIAWQTPDETIEVALWGQNLLDEEYASNSGGFVADEGSGLGAAHTGIDNPLTGGIDFRWSFY